MRETPTYLQNHVLVVEVFGHWPDFHDSPVRRFTASPEAVELEVEAWEMTPEVDARGYFILTKKHRVGFRFTGLIASDLASFIAENILFELGFSSNAGHAASGCFEVRLDSAMGGDLCGSLTATCGAVTFVTPLAE